MGTPENSNTTNPEAKNLPIKPNGNMLTTSLIVIIVILLFVMLLVNMNGNMLQSSDTSGDDIAALTSRNIQLRTKTNEARANRGLPPLPENPNSALTMATRIQRDASSLAAMTSQWQAELKKKDELLRERDSEIAAYTQNTQRLYAQIKELNAKLDLASGTSEQIVRLTNDLKIARNKILNSNKQLQELIGRPTNEAVTILRKQLNDSLDAHSKLELQIDKLKFDAKNVVSQETYDDLAAELALLKPKMRKQRYEIQRMRTQIDLPKLFLKSDKDLPAKPARLLAELRRLNDANEQQLNTSYENIATTIGAKIIHRQSFAKGSAQIDFDREAIIRHIINKSNDANAYFLVVGYDSKSGEKERGKTLCSQRAATLASIVNTLRNSKQEVQAIYLGETTRFSKTDEVANQICEIWEIKR